MSASRKEEKNPHWIQHRGGEFAGDTRVDVLVRFRNGRESGPSPAWHWRWKSWGVDIGPSDWDIVAWKVAADSKAI